MQQFLSYKNIKIAFSEEGKGSAVVLLHGFLESSYMWKEISTELSKKNRVICIDLLGHGDSDCLSYVHTMEEMAEVVKAILKQLKIRRATLIGHSMGGYVALAFSEKYPKNTKRICLLNSTSQADNEKRKKLRLRAIKMAQTNYKSLVSMSITNLFPSNTVEQFSMEIEKCKKEAFKVTVQGYIACTEGIKIRQNREHVLASKKYKKLIIIGKRDAILNYQSIIEESQRTNTPLITLSNGHMSHIENKKELINVLINFVKS